MSHELRLDVSRLKRARLERALTQEELAEMAGIHPVTLARIETGFQTARKSSIRALASALGLTVLDLAEVAEKVSA